jgi:hypothetical protein
MDLLGPTLDHGHVVKAELSADGTQKRDPLALGLDETDGEAGIRKPHGQTWNPGSSPDIDNRKRPLWW